MPEIEISEHGTLAFNGERVGEIQGLRFLPDSYAFSHLSEIDRQTLSQAAATAIVARGQQIAEAPNEQFILSSDNILRWRGIEVARIVAGISEIEPELQLLADDAFTGTHREWVEARLKAYLRHHISMHLKPLFDLRAAESLPEGARGIGFQLIEALGVLERSKVAAEVKALEQTVRAQMRKLGVRFGAHHIYAPATLKPKPRALGIQLWLLKRNEPVNEQMAAILQLAQSGRTAWAADPSLSPEFYRVLGFKLMDARAVRVDILERLADLIRPILSYRENITPGPPPAAYVGAAGFIVTPEMTSLLGVTGDDMAAILRALGYVSESKPRADIEAAIKKAQEDYALKHPAPAPIPEAKPEEPKVEVEVISKEKPEAPAEAPATPPKELSVNLDVWRFPRPERKFEKRAPRREKTDGKPGGEAAPKADNDRRPRRPKHRHDKKEKRENVSERRLVFSTENKKDKAIDPNNPFAKLAALKGQLEQKT